MAGGGFCRLPNGTVVVALTLTRPTEGTAHRAGTEAGPGAPVRVLVHAVNRARALTRLRNLGLRAVYLRGNDRPPTPDEVTAVLHHPDGLLWRAAPEAGPATQPALALQSCQELWHPIRALLGPAGYAGPARPAA
ncbi:hypothetical protein [Streptomyces sp. YIM 132580]|uniref:hypothetical protein n=1 Tax=Streptomyces sp. YIM 132580 TaxID=2691958 RepID=UPI00136AD137|nr:hypothetical protein [Streptomyces sp. YIM 132580]MXG25626.1 hypothetical protein [Streptomyces sp. YIM 132580]